MRIGQAFPTKYLKADDLTRPVKVQIAAVHIENVGTEQKAENKPVMYFLYQGRQAEKGMILNRTNADTIAMDLGDETDAWIGHTVELFKMRVQGPNGIVDGIRLRVVHPATNPVSAFAPAAVPPPQPNGPFGPTPPLATPGSYGAKPDDLDENIPF